MFYKISLTCIFMICCCWLMAQKTVLINNVYIFNGKEEKLLQGNVLIVGNKISKISTGPIATNKSGNTVIVNGKGLYLIPGLIDAHAHTMMDAIPMQEA